LVEARVEDTVGDAEVSSGLPGPVEEVFGAFEPRFYGVSLILASPAHFRAWQGLQTDDAADPAPELDPFARASLDTALEHEIRHFHDALISPFASAILFMRLLAAYSGIRLLKYAQRLGGNCLPVPATRWMYMSDDERKAWLAGIGSPEEVAQLHPLPLPTLTHLPRGEVLAGLESAEPNTDEIDMEALARATFGFYEGAARFISGASAIPVFKILAKAQITLDGDPFEIDAIAAPRNVFEVSAVALQLQAAWTNGDGSAFKPLVRFIETSDLPYARLFRRFMRAVTPAGRPPQVHLHKISAAAIWCILGNGDSQTSRDPSLRCLKLLGHLDHVGGMADDFATAVAWDEWDAAIGLTPWHDGLIDLHRSTVANVNQMIAEERTDGEPIFSTVLRQYADDQRKVLDLLLTSPDRYVFTHDYLTREPDALPSPLISIELGGDFVIPIGDISEEAPVRFPRLFEQDGVRGWHRMVHDSAPGARTKLLDAALAMERVCQISDVVFSNEALRPLEQEVLTQAVGNVLGVRTLNVF
jgi:hypothetical protein